MLVAERFVPKARALQAALQILKPFLRHAHLEGIGGNDAVCYLLAFDLLAFT